MKSVVLSIVLLVGSFVGFSQSEKESNEKKLKYGFNLGVNYSNLLAKESLPNNSDIYNEIGFSAGLIMNYKLTEDLSISPKVELSINKSGIKTTNNDDSVSLYKIFPASLDIMTHLIYKIGNGNTTPYVLVGPKLNLPVFGKSKSDYEYKNSTDFSIDLGIGLENKLKHFSISPEIRYSLGLFNINENPNFKTLNYHKISLVLNII
ncbi:porin family protein [Psychroserpens sp. AS72]|uniref:porin family protein n=1 Tax=Psychroserpens sp. AS72 TaxID=3135775 RepID=UPI003170FA5C